MTKSEFIQSIRQYIADGKTEEALELLKEKIQEFDASLVNDITLLVSRFQNAKNDFVVKGILPRDEHDRTVAQVNYAVLEIIEKLEKTAQVISSAPKDKTRGKILHNIPGTMPVDKETRCTVRIAYDELNVTRDFKMTADTVIEDVRIADVMSVELVDFNETPAFQIRTITEEEQFVVTDDYTQWLFMVKALREGKYPLTLKVSVIEQIDGKDRKRDIVLEKEIFIVSQATVAAPAPPQTDPMAKASDTIITEATGFEETNIKLNYIVSDDTTRGVPPPQSSAGSSGGGGRSGARVLSLLATIAVALTGFYLIFKPSFQNKTDTKPGEIVFSKPDDIKNNPNDVAHANPDDNEPVTSSMPPKVDTIGNIQTVPKPMAIPKAPSQKQTDIASNTKRDKEKKPSVQANKPPIITPKGSDKDLPQAQYDDGGGTSDTINSDGKKNNNANSEEELGELKHYRVRVIMKDAMKSAQIMVNGKKPNKIETNIWGTPQFVEFDSRLKKQTFSFTLGGITCKTQDIVISNGDMVIESCSFKKKKQ